MTWLKIFHNKREGVMEIRQVQSFVHVAKLGSFSRAAETMGYSQSAITVQIRLLEEELGTKLFDRMGKKVSLTPQGKRFLEHANRILYEMNRTIMAMNEDRELENPLHIGTIESLCTAKFPRILSQFHTLYPKVNIQITLPVRRQFPDSFSYIYFSFSIHSVSGMLLFTVTWSKCIPNHLR